MVNNMSCPCLSFLAMLLCCPVAVGLIFTDDGKKPQAVCFTDEQ